MTESTEVTLRLSDDVAAALDAAVESGAFDNRSAVVRQAIEDWRGRTALAQITPEALRTLAAEGVNSGDGLDADVVFDRLRERYASASDD